VSAPADRVLRGRDFRLLWTGQSISKAGSAVTTFALPLVVVQTLTTNPLLLGVLNAMIWLPWLLIGLQAGAWADRRSRRPLMIGCQLASAVLIVSVPVAAGLHVLTIGYVIVIAFAAGCSNVVFTAAYNAYVPFLVGKSNMLGANSRLTGSEQATNIAGPGIGGLLAQFATAVLGLVVDAASFLVSAACLWAIRAKEPDDHPAGRPRTSVRADVRSAVDFVARDPYLRVLTANSALANLFLSGLQALMVVFLVRTAGLSPWAVGAVTVVISVGGFLGAFVAPRISRRLGSARALLVSTPITGFFGLLFPLAGHGWRLVLALAGVFAWSLGVVMKNVVTGSFRQAYCPPGMRGRVAMSVRFVIFGVMPVGSLLGGALGSAFGVRAAIWVLAIANVFSSAMLFTGPIRHRRELPTESLAAAAEGST
jgi:MFS family permease